MERESTCTISGVSARCSVNQQGICYPQNLLFHKPQWPSSLQRLTRKCITDRKEWLHVKTCSVFSSFSLFYLQVNNHQVTKLTGRCSFFICFLQSFIHSAGNKWLLCVRRRHFGKSTFLKVWGYINHILKIAYVLIFMAIKNTIRV